MKKLKITMTAFAILLWVPVLVNAADHAFNSKGEVPGKPFKYLQHQINKLRSDLETIELTPGPIGPQGPQGEPGPAGSPGESCEELRARVEFLENSIEDLQTILAGIWRHGDTIIFEGVNVQIVSGTGNTDGAPNGRGNLIVGYNEERQSYNERAGSHNIVVGMRHNYSSYGGLVVGDSNTITGAFSSVSGGTENEANGVHSAVSGGIGRSIADAYEWCGGPLRAADQDGSVTIETDSDITLTSGGQVSLKGNLLGLESAITMDISTGGSTVNLTGSSIDLASPRIGLNVDGSGKPAARVGDPIVCAGGAGKIIHGSATVLIGD